MKKLMESFVKNMTENMPGRIINEFNVQFYLGVDLLISNYEVRMEDKILTGGHAKSYPDILCKKNRDEHGIEVKVLLKGSGGTKSRMEGMMTDAKFLGQLVSNNSIKKGYAVTITNDPYMYDGENDPECDDCNREMYSLFRNKDKKVKLFGFEADWLETGEYHSYVMEIVR